MHGRHFDAAFEPGEVFESYGLVFVVADYILHHQLWRKGFRCGEVAGEVEARGAVEVGVGNVEVVGAGWSD